MPVYVTFWCGWYFVDSHSGIIETIIKIMYLDTG